MGNYLINRLKKEIERYPGSQKELAAELGIAPPTLGNYLHGRRKPSYEMLVKIAEILGCTVDYLVGNTDVRNQEAPEVQLDEDEVREVIARITSALNEAEKSGIIDHKEKLNVLVDLEDQVNYKLYKVSKKNKK